MCQDTSVVVENFSIIIKAPKAAGLFLNPRTNLLVFLKMLFPRLHNGHVLFGSFDFD